jgi:hypothetical protein
VELDDIAAVFLDNSLVHLEIGGVRILATPVPELDIQAALLSSRLDPEGIVSRNALFAKSIRQTLKTLWITFDRRVKNEEDILVLSCPEGPDEILYENPLLGGNTPSCVLGL